MQPGQVIYTPWCNEHGQVVDDGTVSRLAEDRFRWTAAEPNLRWISAARRRPEGRTSKTSRSGSPRSRCRGRPRRRCSAPSAEADIDDAEVLPRHPRAHRRPCRRNLAHRLHRRSRLRDLDAMRDAAARLGCHRPRGDGVRPAADRAARAGRRAHRGRAPAHRRRFLQRRKALTHSQLYSPFEMGFDRLVDIDKDAFIGRTRWRPSARRGPKRRIVGLAIEWPDVERLYDAVGLPPMAGDRLARRGAGVCRHPSDRPHDVVDVVTRAEADDRPRDGRDTVFGTGFIARSRTHGGRGAPQSRGLRGADPVFQPETQDANPARMILVMGQRLRPSERGWGPASTE